MLGRLLPSSFHSLRCLRTHRMSQKEKLPNSLIHYDLKMHLMFFLQQGCLSWDILYSHSREGGSKGGRRRILNVRTSPPSRLAKGMEGLATRGEGCQRSHVPNFTCTHGLFPSTERRRELRVLCTSTVILLPRRPPVLHLSGDTVTPCKSFTQPPPPSPPRQKKKSHFLKCTCALLC